jgi:hypothetical protein
LIKYIFLLIGEVSDACLLILAILLGLIHCIPMFFEAKKSRKDCLISFEVILFRF